MGSGGFELKKLFRNIRRQRFTIVGARLRERGRRAEEQAFRAAQILKDRGQISDWREADDELDRNGVDLVIVGPRGSEYLFNVKTSDGAIQHAGERGRLFDWVGILKLPPGTTDEQATEIILQGVEEMGKKYFGNGA